MSSLGDNNNNQNNWPPYDSYKDCSQGICTIYCPQWCYMIFPPPPFRPRDEDGGGSGTNFSPLIIAVIAILASAFLLVSYYTIISKYCKRGRNRRNPRSELDFNITQMTQDQLHTIPPSGLDESLIKAIPVCKYKKGDGFVEESECSVCLSEFKDDESLRLLPKCSHAFHLPCIDTWLRSHSNCPLCRSVVSFAPLNSSINISSLQIQGSEAVFMMDECERGQVEEVYVRGVINDGDHIHSDDTNMANLETGNMIQENESLRRSVSLGSSSFRRNLLISDILKIEEEDEEDDLRVGEFRSSMKRSISTGRFLSTAAGKGKNPILPN